MGRKPNPKGKDRTRTVSLDGDVADIAQELADKSQLSKVISQLLRNAYNISDEVSRMKEQLEQMTNKRKVLQHAEAELIEAIDEAERRIIHDRNHVLPSLYQRQGVLEERLRKLRARQAYLPPKEATLVQDQIMETNRILTTGLKEIEELEE